MNPYPLISADELALRLDQHVLIDCRADLFDTARGHGQYLAGHLPGAFFMALHADLSGPKTPGSGRHPLPDRTLLARTLRSFGVDRATPIVAYDASGGAYAARLWWLARWLGHAQVQVLDGGLEAWVRAGYPLHTEVPASAQHAAARIAPRDSAGVPEATSALESATPLEATVDTAQILAALGSAQLLLVDARAAERWRGEVEPLDPVAGHIPGARNRPHSANLRPDGRFKPAEVLRAEWVQLLGDPAASPRVVHSCGSGVSACHNLLALRVAGLEGSALHPGSWSEWCADPTRPVERAQ